MYAWPEEESYDLIEFKDGKIFERHSLPQKIEDKIVGRVWSFSDVTDRKRYEEQLRDSDEKTRLLVEQSPVGIAIFQDSRYRFANPELIKIFGCESKGQVIGEPSIAFHN